MEAAEDSSEVRRNVYLYLSLHAVYQQEGSSSLRLVWAELGRRPGEVVFVSCRGEAGASGEAGAWASVAQVDTRLGGDQ